MSNINDLISIISIDKFTYNLFSHKFCWDIIFHKNDLPLSNIIYDDTNHWLVAFKKEVKLKIYTDRLMDILEHPKIRDFDELNNLDDDAYDENSIIHKQIKEADEINKQLSASMTPSLSTSILSYTTHPQAVYTSKLLDFKNLPEPKNVEVEDYSGN